MSKRMPVEIIAEILEQCLEENSKTRIMYRSNLSFEGVTKYLAWLTSIGLLQKDPSTRKYQTTPKGEELLSCWSETCKLLEIEKQNRQIELISETGRAPTVKSDSRFGSAMLSPRQKQPR